MRTKTILAIICSAILSWSCASAPRPRATEVTEIGDTLVRATGPVVEAEVGLRWARRHLGDEYLVLTMMLAGADGGAVKVDYASIRIRTPRGVVLAPLDRDEFRRQFGQLAAALRMSDAWQPTSARALGGRTPCRRWFVAPPGEIGFDSLYLSPFDACFGPLVFRVPGGVQPGRWVLTVDLEEADLSLPLVLE